MSKNIQQIKTFKTALTKLKKWAQVYLRSKDIPLAERWKAYCEIGMHVCDDEAYIIHFKSLPDRFIMYDGPFHMERHQSVTGASMVETIEENIEWAKESKSIDSAPDPYDDINIDALKEEILDKFIWSFTYDW